MNYPRTDRKFKASLSAALILAVFTLAAYTAAAQTAAPNRPASPNGKIVYSSNERGADMSIDQIWVMDADGKRKTRLTNTTFSDTAPAFSPDGQTIAFNRNDGGNHLLIMNADGSNVREVCAPNFTAAKIEWSPGGQQLKYEEFLGDTYVVQVFANGSFAPSAPVRLDGGNNAFSVPFEDARWSPDGSKLVGTANGPNGFGVYLINPNNTGKTLLSAAAPIVRPHPVWSPDGTKVIYAGFANNNSEIMFVNAAGGTPVNITNTPNDDESVPELSPDGAKIAFLTSDGFTMGVGVVGAPGAPALAPTRLADIAGDTANSFKFLNKVMWSPDSTMIVYHDDVVSNQTGSLANSQDIHVVDADGSRLSNYTRSRHATETFGNWQKVTP